MYCDKTPKNAIHKYSRTYLHKGPHMIWHTINNDPENTRYYSITDYVVTRWSSMPTIYGFATEYCAWVCRRSTLGSPACLCSYLQGDEPSVYQDDANNYESLISNASDCGMAGYGDFQKNSCETTTCGHTQDTLEAIEYTIASDPFRALRTEGCIAYFTEYAV